jgi:hypothetical protein
VVSADVIDGVDGEPATAGTDVKLDLVTAATATAFELGFGLFAWKQPLPHLD